MKGKRSKIVMVLLLAIMLIASACSGGGAATNPGSNGGSSNPQSGGQDNDAPENTEPIVINVMLTAAEPPPPDNVIEQKILEELNIQLNIQTYLPDDYQNRLNVSLAGGTPADIFFVERQALTRLAGQGILFDFTPYLDQLAPTVAFIGEDNLIKGTFDGAVLGIPQTERAYQYAYWVRQDWLNKLDLDAPKTLEDFKRVASALTFDDPDGNKRNDTYGFSGRPIEALGPLFGAFGTTYPGHFYVKDGKLTNSVYDPAMLDALEYIRDLVASNVVDPDFLANTGLRHRDKAFQGQLGMFYFNWPNITSDAQVSDYKAINPDAQWAFIPGPVGPGGQYTSHRDLGAASFAAFPKSIEQEPEKLEKMLELLNYVSTPEGSRLVMYGLEGVHYEVQDEQIVTTEASSELNYIYLYQFTGRDEMVYLANRFPKQQEAFMFANDQARIETYDSFIIPPEEFVLADAKRYIEEELFKFVYNRRPLSEYDDFLKTLETTFRFSMYSEAAEEQLREQGVIE